MNNQLLYNFLKLSLRKFSDNFNIIQKGNPCLFSLENKKYSACISYIHDSGEGRTNDDEERVQIDRKNIDFQIARKDDGYIPCFLGFTSLGDVVTAWDPAVPLSFKGKKRMSVYTRNTLVELAKKNNLEFFFQRSNNLGKKVRHPIFGSELLGLYLQNIELFHDYDEGVPEEDQKNNIKTQIRKNTSFVNEINTNISIEEEIQTTKEKKTIICKRTAYQRDPKFTKKVLEAYKNKCAICNIQLGIIEAAHIIPHSLPEGTNKVNNGIALCRNHHKLYDNGLIILELNQKISINEEVKNFLDQSSMLNGLNNLLSEISKGYSIPNDKRLQPKRENLEFGKKYRLSQ